jgi:hypothetical protein
MPIGDVTVMGGFSICNLRFAIDRIGKTLVFKPQPANCKSQIANRKSPRQPCLGQFSKDIQKVKMLLVPSGWERETEGVGRKKIAWPARRMRGCRAGL